MTAVAETSWLGRHVAAEERLRRLIAAEPSARYAPYAVLASALEGQGRDREAYEVLTEAVGQFPYDHRAHNKRCRLAGQAGDWSAAMESCNRAVELAPDRAYVRERRLKSSLSMCERGARQRRCTELRDRIAALERGENPFGAPESGEGEGP
jgi:tetratricopeptide (TPR) repeat protein